MADDLETRLRALGRHLEVEVPSALPGAVLDRIRQPEPKPSRRLRRWLAGLFLGLLGVGAVASPVGASILDWFGFHGVAVVEGPTSTSEAPDVPAETRLLDLDRVAGLAGFVPVVPAELGEPDGVAVSSDRRVVSLTWGTGDDTVRLDEFLGTIDPLFWKTADDARIVSLVHGDALWLPTPHHVSVVGQDGSPHALAPRLAAPTLVWTYGDLTLRLEGDHSLERAVEVAESTP